MVNRKLFFVAIFVLGLLAIVPLATAEPTSLYTLEHDDTQRSYELFVPSDYDAAESMPLIIALHGIYSDAESFRIQTGLDAAAEERGFIVAYPNSLYGYWDDGRVDEGMYPFDGNVDDRGFMLGLIDALSDEYAIDTERVYLTGMNNGGGMALTMACATPERFAGIAVVATGMWNYHTANCPDDPATGVNLLMMLGMQDEATPVAGKDWGIDASITGKHLEVLGIEDAARFWLKRYECSEKESFIDDPARVIEFSDCETPARIIVNMVRGAGGSWMRVGEDYKLNQYGVDATEVITRFFAGDEDWYNAAAPTEVASTLARTYIVNLPSSYDPAVPMPIVFVLHGRPSSANGMAFITEMHEVGEAHDFITVYPNGLNNEWNYARGLPGYDVQTPRDDVQFMRDLIHDLSLDFAIDPNRIYVTGFSNGGFMTERLACEAPDQFAAFAVVGATGFALMENVCSDVPVPIMFMHGTHDISIPWTGDKRELNGQTITLLNSIPETLVIWSVHNGCDVGETETQDIPKKDPDALTDVKVFTISKCPAGIGMQLYAISYGGHTWAGVENLGVIAPEIAGDTNMDINAGEVIWEFFEQYPQEE